MRMTSSRYLKIDFKVSLLGQKQIMRNLTLHVQIGKSSIS
jgi:hypothetical protein